MAQKSLRTILLFWVFLWRQWTVLKLLGIMDVLIAGEGAVCFGLSWPSRSGWVLCMHLVQPVYSCVAAAELVLPYGALMEYVDRSPKQTWWSARKLAPWCYKLSCSIWPGQQNSGCCILSTAVREWGTHMEKEGVDLDLSFLPASAAGRLLTLGIPGVVPLRCWIHTEDFLVVFVPSSTSQAMGACSALLFSVGEWLAFLELLFVEFYRPRNFLLGLSHLDKRNMWSSEFCTYDAIRCEVLRGCSAHLRDSQSAT